MARALRDSRLDTRTARLKLRISGAPYWQKLGPELHIGYRKGTRARTWLMRRYLRDRAKPYVVEAIGEADDLVDANGGTILTFFQAQDRARARARELADRDRLEKLGPVVTVRSAVKEYVSAREKRDAARSETRRVAPDEATKGMKRDARSRLQKHVLAIEKLADKRLAALTVEDLMRWREGLAFAPGSVQRIVNDFKAALNASARRARDQLPPTIRDTIKDGLATTKATPAVAREAQVLSDADVRAIVAAAWFVDAAGVWEGDLARLVLALAATGARFSQLIRMTVADVQATRLMVPSSHKGREVKHVAHVAVRVGEDVLDALAVITAGRGAAEPLFLRPHWEQTGIAQWVKRRRVPWYAAAELTRPWSAIAKRAGLAASLVPYSLRHSSIVRGLRAGLPVRLVAALHDTSSAMIERHYAAYVVDALDELAARAVVPLMTAATMPRHSN